MANPEVGNFVSWSARFTTGALQILGVASFVLTMAATLSIVSVD
jgi:hypothetical protein